VVLLQAFADQAAIALQNAASTAESQTSGCQLTQILESTSDGVLFVKPRRPRAAATTTPTSSSAVRGLDGRHRPQQRARRECSRASTTTFWPHAKAPRGGADEGASGDLDVPKFNRVLHWEARATRDAPAGRPA